MQKSFLGSEIQPFPLILNLLISESNDYSVHYIQTNMWEWMAICIEWKLKISEWYVYQYWGCV